MNITVIYDTPKGKEIALKIEQAAAKNQCNTTFIDAALEPLEGCLGCFNCWIKTPGICIQKKNDSTPYLKKVYDKAYVIYVSKVTFGGYSSKIKAYVDRILPISHPYFVKVNDEMHHKVRYATIPGILAVGYDCCSDKAAETFQNFVQANMRNSRLLQKGFKGCFICDQYNSFDVDLDTWITNVINVKRTGESE